MSRSEKEEETSSKAHGRQSGLGVGGRKEPPLK